MRVAVFGSSLTTPDEDDYLVAVELGGLLARDGHVVYTGGYGGLMEAVSAGAARAGGHVVGVTASPVFPGRSGPNHHVAEIIDAASLSERIHRIVSETEASIALPGSIGTLTELMVAWNSAFVSRFSSQVPKPVITMGRLWRDTLPTLARHLDTDPSLVRWAETPAVAVEMLRDRSRPG